MALVNLTNIQTQDYSVLADGENPVAGSRVAVPLARLTEEGESFFETAGEVGVIIPTDASYKSLAPLANKLAFAVIDFSAFGDGRGFSLAVRLRKDLGFKGEIRATGPVIPDQALFLLRAGFDTLEVADNRAAAFEAALERFDAFYQTDFTGHVSVAHVRHGAENSAATIRQKA